MKGDGSVGGGAGQSRHQGGHGAVGRVTEGYHEASEDHGLAGLRRDGAGMLLHAGTRLPAAQRGLRLKRHVRYQTAGLSLGSQLGAQRHQQPGTLPHITQLPCPTATSCKAITKINRAALLYGCSELKLAILPLPYCSGIKSSSKPLPPHYPMPCTSPSTPMGLAGPPGAHCSRPGDAWGRSSSLAGPGTQTLHEGQAQAN